MGLGTLINGLVGKFLRPKIGAFGGLVFEASSFKVLTFDKYRRSSRAKYAKHSLINKTEELEFTGLEAEKISLEINLNACVTTKLFSGKSTGAKILNSLASEFLGLGSVNPKAVANDIRKMMTTAEHNYLVIGNEVIGDNQWVITDVQERVQFWDNAAQIQVSTLEITFMEYVIDDNDNAVERSNRDSTIIWG